MININITEYSFVFVKLCMLTNRNDKQCNMNLSCRMTKKQRQLHDTLFMPNFVLLVYVLCEIRELVYVLCEIRELSEIR